MHGLRGHPKETWEAIRAGSEDAGNATSSERKSFKSFFKSISSASTADNRTGDDRSGKLFWPDEYLTEDIPEARVWAYGYNADAIGGLFQANNKNSVSQHGRDLAVKIEREIENEVARSAPVLERQADDEAGPRLFVAHSLGGILVKDVSTLAMLKGDLKLT